MRDCGAANVLPVSFDYGQRHKVELECADRIARAWGLPLPRIVNLAAYGAACNSALTRNGSVAEPHPLNAELPASFVPGRNAVMLAIAHGIAQSVGAVAVYGGQCETDYSGYPDCRRIFVDALEHALNLGSACPDPVRIVTPLMYLNKAQTFGLAHKMGVLEDVLEMSHTCYNGVRAVRHPWGYGCNECPACRLRAVGYAEYLNS